MKKPPFLFWGFLAGAVFSPVLGPQIALPVAIALGIGADGVTGLRRRRDHGAVS